MFPSASIFGRVVGRKINSWELSMNQVWNRVWHKMLIFTAGIDFSSPADSCHILFACWKRVEQIGVSLPHTQHMPTTILKSLIPSHEIDVSKNQFHNGIYFSQGIDSVELMQGALKIRAHDWSYWNIL